MSTPYDSHLCAADPAGFALGFARARVLVERRPAAARQIHDLLATHVGKLPWPVFGIFTETAYHEGLLLGVYGLVALDALA
jgi:hypothetical protein